MLWAVGFVIFGIFEGSLATNELCQESLSDVCTPGMSFPPPMPGNEEELAATCSVLLTYVRCVKRYRESCPDAENIMEDIDTVHSVLKEVCRKTSFLNTVILENLPCIKAVRDAHKDTCFEPAESILGAHVVYLIEPHGLSEGEVNLDKWRAHNCLIRVYDISCFASNVFKSCGRLAKDAIMHVLNRINFVKSSCTDQAIEELSPFLKTIDLEAHEKLIMDELLQAAEN